MDVLTYASDREIRNILADLAAADASMEMIGCCTSQDDLAVRLKRDPPDIAILQVESDSSIVDTVGNFRQEPRPLFVILSGSADTAVKAFDVGAFDFIRLPANSERLVRTIARARSVLARRRLLKEMSRRVAQLQEQLQGSNGRSGMERLAYPDRLIIKTSGGLAFLDPRDVDWIEATDVYVRLHNGEKSHLVRERLKNVEQKLNPEKFLRIHRSTIVNVDRIREVMPHAYGGAVVVLHDGTKLKVSRTYRDRLNPTFG